MATNTQRFRHWMLLFLQMGCQVGSRFHTSKLSISQNLSLAADCPADVIADAVKRLKDSHYHPNTMGVQFVQIGNEDSAKQALKDLAKGDNGVR
jgi:hypothetical protein